MTTPTREQVVQWMRDSGFSSHACRIETTSGRTFAHLARADLEATIAQQEKEIEKWKLATSKNAECIRSQHNELVEQMATLCEKSDRYRGEYFAYKIRQAFK